MQSSIRISFIKSALEQYNGQFASLIKERYLDPLENWTDDNHLNKFIGLVEASVDLDQLENGEYMISSGYDSHLSVLKNEQESLEHQIHDLHRKAANDLDLALDKALKLEKGTQYGYAFRITKKEEPKVRKKLNTHFIVLETRKDGVKFTNTKLKKLSDQYQKVVEEYKNCQKELVARVVQTAASFSEVSILRNAYMNCCKHSPPSVIIMMFIMLSFCFRCCKYWYFDYYVLVIILFSLHRCSKD